MESFIKEDLSAKGSRTSQVCPHVAWSMDADSIPHHTDSTGKDKIFNAECKKTES